MSEPPAEVVPSPKQTPRHWVRVQLAAGESSAGLWDLSSEVPEARLVVGSAHDVGWTVAAEGVAAEAFELYWDGAMLWVSPPLGGTLTVDGERVQRWRQLPGRCRLQFGQGALLVESSQSAGLAVGGGHPEGWEPPPREDPTGPVVRDPDLAGDGAMKAEATMAAVTMASAGEVSAFGPDEDTTALVAGEGLDHDFPSGPAPSPFDASAPPLVDQTPGHGSGPPAFSDVSEPFGRRRVETISMGSEPSELATPMVALPGTSTPGTSTPGTSTPADGVSGPFGSRGAPAGRGDEATRELASPPAPSEAAGSDAPSLASPDDEVTRASLGSPERSLFTEGPSPTTPAFGYPGASPETPIVSAGFSDLTEPFPGATSSGELPGLVTRQVDLAALEKSRKAPPRPVLGRGSGGSAGLLEDAPDPGELTAEATMIFDPAAGKIRSKASVSPESAPPPAQLPAGSLAASSFGSPAKEPGPGSFGSPAPAAGPGGESAASLAGGFAAPPPVTLGEPKSRKLEAPPKRTLVLAAVTLLVVLLALVFLRLRDDQQATAVRAAVARAAEEGEAAAREGAEEKREAMRQAAAQAEAAEQADVAAIAAELETVAEAAETALRETWRRDLPDDAEARVAAAQDRAVRALAAEALTAGDQRRALAVVSWRAAQRPGDDAAQELADVLEADLRCELDRGRMPCSED
ncbi:MAG: hypothetical protein AAF447_12630 [Myxococcota bacterium]